VTPLQPSLDGLADQTHRRDALSMNARQLHGWCRIRGWSASANRRGTTPEPTHASWDERALTTRPPLTALVLITTKSATGDCIVRRRTARSMALRYERLLVLVGVRNRSVVTTRLVVNARLGG
jgi:hypothetical protein